MTELPQAVKEIDTSHNNVIEAEELQVARPEQLKAIIDSLSTKELTDAVKIAIRASLTTAMDIIDKKATPLDPKEQEIKALYLKLFPEKALEKIIKWTNTPSANINNLFEATGTPRKIDLTQIGNLLKEPERIQEMFSTLNKADLKLLLPAIKTITLDATQIANIAKNMHISEDIIKKSTDLIDKVIKPTFIKNMVQNGFVIDTYSNDNSDDVNFLKTQGWEKIKAFLDKAENKLLLDKKETLVLKGSEDSYTLQSPIQEGKLIDWLDLSKLNIANTADIKKELLEAGWEAFSKAVGNISSMLNESTIFNNEFGKLLKMFLQICGLYRGSKEWEKWLNGLSESQKIERLSKMIEKRFNEKNEFSILKAWKLPDDKKTTEFQQYTKDVQDLMGITEFSKTEVWVDKKPSLEYGEETTKKVNEIQELLKTKNYLQSDPTGVFDETTASAYKKFLTNKKEPEKDAPAQTKAPDADPEKNKYTDLMNQLRWKSFAEIKKSPDLINLIHIAFDIKSSERWFGRVYWKNTILKVKAFQKDLWFTENNPDPTKNADGKIGKHTIDAFFAKTSKIAPSVTTTAAPAWAAVPKWAKPAQERKK